MILASVVALLCGGGASARTTPDDWVRGFNFTDWSPDFYASPTAAESLRQLQATGANAVALIPTWYQASRKATTIAPDSQLSPTDQSIAAIVARAKAAGLRVFLRPVVDSEGITPRFDFDPASPQAWFRSYRRFIDHYATLAQTLGVDMLSVGHEYHRLDGPRFTTSWRRVIAGVRRRFHGPLTYGANSDDAWTHVRFWDDLDVIGIDAYFSLSTGHTLGVPRIVSHWRKFTDRRGTTHRYLNAMATLSRRDHKPIVFTEVGYPSTRDALVKPWNPGKSYDAVSQQRAFEALFRALADKCWFRGLYIWDWSANPAAGDPRDADHTPQGKPAAHTIQDWFTASTPRAAGAARRRARCSS